MSDTNDQLAAKRNEKRIQAAKLADTGPCGYCGKPSKSDLCPDHEHMRYAYREADDRWQSETDEDISLSRRAGLLRY